VDEGERWMLKNVVGKDFIAWNSHDLRLRSVYDPLHRPSDLHPREGAGPELLERVVYGETQPDSGIRNQRQRVVQVFDQAGVVNNNDYDSKGNLLHSQRQLAQNYKATLDWSTAVPLEDLLYTSGTSYNALNRAIEPAAPDNSGLLHAYSEANLLDQIRVNLRGEQRMASRLGCCSLQLSTMMQKPRTLGLNMATDSHHLHVQSSHLPSDQLSDIARFRVTAASSLHL
jgi:hypothetical protein